MMTPPFNIFARPVFWTKVDEVESPLLASLVLEVDMIAEGKL